MTGTVNPADVTEVVREQVRGGHIPKDLFGLSGIDLLRSLQTEQIPLPPIHYLTGMRFTEVGTGTATFTLPITDWLKTPQGIVTGGEVAILADGPLGYAVQSVLPPGTGFTTTELSISMVRPVPASGNLIARGSLVHGGRQLALSEVFVTDDTGRLIAHGTSRCFVFQVPAAPSPPSDNQPAHREDADGWVAPYQRPALGTVLDDDIWSSQSGLEVMDELVTGALPPPPLAYLIGCRPVDASEGRCVFQLPATEWLTSPSGFVEGGCIACIADLSPAAAVQTTMPAGTSFAPTDLHVQLIRPVLPDGQPLTATGTVVHRGRTVAASRAEVTNAGGKLVATATGSAVILPGRRADLRDVPHLG